MKKVFFAVSFFIMALIFSSCSLVFQSGDGNLGYFPQATGYPMGYFENTAEFWYVLSPFIAPLSEPYSNIENMIRPKLVEKGADFAKDVKIGYGFTVVDMLINYFVPFVGRDTITVEGQAFKLP